MGKEYDLMNELGRGNWIDAVAGEAVVLGSYLNDLELVAKGTELAEMVRAIKYDSDGFYLVEVKAKQLEAVIVRLKETEARSVYIDKFCLGEEVFGKVDDEWEFDFVLAERRYEIRMMLPTYRDKVKLNDRVKALAESETLSVVTEHGAKLLTTEVVRKVFSNQEYITTCFYDEDRLVRRIIDHQHDPADRTGRGHLDIFYFDDFETATKAWKMVREATTSSKK
ncbi:MAG: hypothetical protein UW42_C0044G0002 [Candidatus Collierbacteria bacterium GW2011_GWB1_44_197]|nr:MAG: hypothetical protein UW42_C0044G0002 [Candidatus Collierbacteria bacterium GW2011_GWB1_44_197]